MADDFEYPPEDYILLGRVGKPHGLQGEFKVICYSEQPENVATYAKLHLVNRAGLISEGLSIIRCRVQGKNAIVQLSGVTSRSKAEEINCSGVLVAKADLPEISETEFYYHQFHGKLVINKDGNSIGTVSQIFHNGAQDVLVLGKGKEEIFIPITENTLIRETEQELFVDVPPGLLELNQQ